MEGIQENSGRRQSVSGIEQLDSSNNKRTIINQSSEVKENIIPPRLTTQSAQPDQQYNDSGSGEFHEMPEEKNALEAPKAFRKSITDQAKTKIQLTFKNVVITADIKKGRNEPIETKTIINDVSGTILPG